MRTGRVMGFVIGIVAACAIAAVAFGGMGSALTHDEALQKLMAGNKRFVSAKVTHRAKGLQAARERLVAGQKPYAIILSCSDSRVPPEIVFDQTLGQIFVVRVAGNVSDPVVLGSIEYAVEHLGSPLIMVMGHEACGAVTAAFDAQGHGSGNIEAVVSPIEPAVRKAKEGMPDKARPEQVEAAIDNNIDIQAEALTRDSPIVKDYVSRGKVRIVKAKYHLRHGEVTLLK